MATLTIQLPNQPPVAHVLKDETITIGRMKGNTIVVEDDSISLSHAKITRKTGEFYLKDLNSTNGTIVNGQPVNEVKLRDRDHVSFGSITCQFEAEIEILAQPPNATDGAAGRMPAPPGPATAPVMAAPITPPPPRTPAPTSALNIAKAATLPAASVQPTGRKSAPSAGRASTSRGVLATLAPVLGGLAGLAVVTFLGWRFLHVGQEEKIAAREPDRPLQEAANKPVIGAKPAKAANPKAVAPAAIAADVAAAEPRSNSLPELVKALQGNDPTERKRAALALHSLGPEPEVRMWSALTLVGNKFYDKATIPIFIRVLQDDNPVLRQLSCLSLGLIPYEDSEKAAVVAALTETADKDLDNEVRNAAVSALNVIDPEAFAKANLK
jgi:predicted component of type VI protein secretion system